MMIKENDPKYYEYLKMAKESMEYLLDRDFYFYGVYQNQFKLDDLIFEAVEDPQDGYRSSMGAICVMQTENAKFFHKKPLAKVTLQPMDRYEAEGYKLVDEKGYIWLEFGTENMDDYYPCFIFHYTPDETQKSYIEIPVGYKSFYERHPEIILKKPEWFSGYQLVFNGY